MSSNASILLIEFNELCPALLDRFMGEGVLPNFRRFYKESQVYETDAGETPPFLEPWIQWVTVHTGKTYQEHQVFNLGDGHRLQCPSVWDTLSNEGLRVLIWGSMNVRHEGELNGAVLPDPWTTETPPFPSTLFPFYRFIQTSVAEHTRMESPLEFRDVLRFGKFMASHGLSPSTVTAIAKQLLSERTGQGRWRRAAILDRLQFDVFKWYHRRLRPQFATFFSNSTAHYQHMHWRNMEPNLYAVKPNAEEQAEFEGAVRFGYEQMDRLLKNLLSLVDDNTTVVFCTALSQQPCLTYEDEGGKVFYRPRDPQALLQFAGIDSPCRVTPVMSEQYQVRFQNELDAEAAERKFQELRAQNFKLLLVRRTGSDVFMGCSIFNTLPADTVLESTLHERRVGFFELFYQVEGMKSGMHHPSGALWIREGNRLHSVHNERIPLTAIGPAIMEHLLPRPQSSRRALAECLNS